LNLEIARFLRNPKEMLQRLAQENVVPVKAPPWAKYPFELRRNEKRKRGQFGPHLAGKETTPLILECLGVRDDKSCKEMRERIKQIRKNLGLR